MWMERILLLMYTYVTRHSLQLKYDCKSKIHDMYSANIWKSHYVSESEGKNRRKYTVLAKDWKGNVLKVKEISIPKNVMITSITTDWKPVKRLLVISSTLQEQANVKWEIKLKLSKQINGFRAHCSRKLHPLF